MSSPLYRTARWLQKRAQQLAEEPLCRMCKGLGKVVAASVADHVVPHRENEDLFWDGELQSLCATCHSRHKQAQEHGRPSAGCDANGIPYARRTRASITNTIGVKT